MNDKLAAQVAEYIQVTDEIIADQQKQIASLRTQKIASAKTETDPVKVGKMLDRIVEAGFILPTQKEASFRAVMQNPACLVDFLEKLAARSVQTVPELGGPVEAKDSAPAGTPVRESDRVFESTFN